jgi:Icc-related predicted phosphoesterase|tara:strand:+ start:2201 stop:2896 length:696 start_codon:yes stop_codon:yes gene_type:complete
MWSGNKLGFKNLGEGKVFILKKSRMVMGHKLKVLAASDIQGNPSVSEKLARQAEKEKVDLVVLCGDIQGVEEDQKGLIAPFKDRNQKVLILPGNWDSFATIDFMANFYGVTNIHGYSAVYKDIGFFGAGAAPTAIGPRSAITEEEMMETLEKAHKGLKGIEKKVMLTHSHPAGSKSEGSGFPGSEAIADAVKKFKPNLLLHGHIEELEGVEEQVGKTRVVNVGPKGRIFEI